MRKWISEKLHLPSDVMSGIPRVEMIGQEQLQVENHLGIEQFSNQEIKLRTTDGFLGVFGENLRIKTIYPQFVFIEGSIQEIRYIT